MQRFHSWWSGRDGSAMRFCENCDAPLGILTREEFMQVYVERGHECPHCGKSVAVIDGSGELVEERPDMGSGRR